MLLKYEIEIAVRMIVPVPGMLTHLGPMYFNNNNINNNLWLRMNTFNIVNLLFVIIFIINNINIIVRIHVEPFIRFVDRPTGTLLLIPVPGTRYPGSEPTNCMHNLFFTIGQRESVPGTR